MRGPEGAAAKAAGAKYFAAGGPEAASAPGKFFICRCSEMHSPAFSEQLMEHYFHCKFI